MCTKTSLKVYEMRQDEDQKPEIAKIFAKFLIERLFFLRWFGSFRVTFEREKVLLPKVLDPFSLFCHQLRHQHRRRPGLSANTEQLQDHVMLHRAACVHATSDR